MASLNITDPNPFRAARAPGARALYEALKAAPISQKIAAPEAMPVVVAPEEELSPIFAHLASGRGAAGASFPRGATFEDGRLDLCKQVVGPEWIGALTRAVRAGGAAAGVEHFLIGNNVVGDAGAEEIARMIADPDAPRLKTLYLAGNAFGAEGARALAGALAEDESVESLWLKRNPLGPKSGAAFGETLARNRTIRTLDLSNAALGDEGVEALFARMAENRALRTLYLDANGLGPRAARAIAAYLEAVKARGGAGLSGLFIGVNRLGCDGARALAEALDGYAPLVRLDLGANRIERDGRDAVLATARGAPSLGFLGLGFYKSGSDLGELPNWFGDDGAAAVADHLAAPSALRAIDLKDAHIGPDGLALLGDGLERRELLFELSAAQFGLKLPALIQRIERLLNRNTRARLGVTLGQYRADGLRALKHGPDIARIDSIYRNTM